MHVSTCPFCGHECHADLSGLTGEAILYGGPNKQRLPRVCRHLDVVHQTPNGTRAFFTNTIYQEAPVKEVSG